MQVRGYVKGVGRAGAFVALSRALEARVKLANLARGFLPHPEQAFPEGALVTGRIVSAADGRCRSFSALPEPLLECPAQSHTSCKTCTQRHMCRMRGPSCFAGFIDLHGFALTPVSQQLGEDAPEHWLCSKSTACTAHGPGCVKRSSAASRLAGCSVRTCRAELSLKEAGWQLGLKDLAEGQSVRGRVRRVERFGVFVTLTGSARLTGLAHISEVADEQVADLAQLFQPGQGAPSLRISLQAACVPRSAVAASYRAPPSSAVRLCARLVPGLQPPSACREGTLLRGCTLLCSHTCRQGDW